MNESKENKEIKESRDCALKKKGLRKYFYYRETSKAGAVFISIALALMFALPLVDKGESGAILLWIVFAFPIYAILRHIVPYQPFFLLLLLYLLWSLLFVVMVFNIDDSGGKGNAWAFIFIFAGIPFGLCFWLGNLMYHTQSIPYAIILASLVISFFLSMG